MRRGKKSLIFLFLIIIGLGIIVTMENYTALKNNGATKLEYFNSSFLGDSSSNTTGNLNYMSAGSYIFETQKWLGESLLNVTCASTGSADLFFYFTSNITRYSFYNNKNSIVWSDDFLTTYGKPLWNPNWDFDNAWSLGAEINSGIRITAGNKKSFLISVGDGDSFDVRIYIRLIATTNGSDNTFKINIVNLLNLSIVESIAIGKHNITHFSVPANDFKLFKLISSITTNNVILLNEITVNNSHGSWIYWHDTLTNIWCSKEEDFTTSISREWMPIYNNFDLTGRSPLGIIFNRAATDLNFTYSSQLAIDSSERIKGLNASGSSMFSTKFLFNASVQDAYFNFQIQEGYFFDIFFRVELNWSVLVDFYSLGTNHGPQDTINDQGINGDEKMSVFFSPVSNYYHDKDSALFIEQESYGVCWYVINGSLNPEMKVIKKLSSLIGFHIQASNNGANPTVNITLEIILRSIENFSNAEMVGIGKTNAGQETAAFPFFQVRQFNTANWRRYQWELQAFNHTNLIKNTFWFCGVDNGNYNNDMNNSLYSPEIKGTENSDALEIEAKISWQLALQPTPDCFDIYVTNGTHKDLLDSKTGDSGGEITFNKTIPSNWIGWDFRIEFNLNTNLFITEKGVTVDDFVVRNSSHIIYENDFESDLSGWTHVDYSGAGDLWHIVIEEVGVNEPVVDIVYQEATYNMVAGKPSTSGIGAYPKVFFDKDPKVQPNTKSYLVYYANGPIQDNFTIKLSVTSFDIVPMTNNQIKFTNDFIYLEAEQQGCVVVNTTKSLTRPRWYYMFNVVDLHYLTFELSEKSILQGHSSITISFYNQNGQTPFTLSHSETHTLQMGINISSKAKTSGIIIVSITDLGYNDYIELIVYGATSPTAEFDGFIPTLIITILSITAGILAVLVFLIRRRYLAASKENLSLKKKLKRMDTKNAKTHPSDSSVIAVHQKIKGEKP